MTVEEIDIIVQAQVDEAMKEFKKLLPMIKQQMKLIQKEMTQALNSIDVTEMKENVDKAVTSAVKKINTVKKSMNTNMKFKIDKKEAEQSFEQTRKSIEALQKQTTQRNNSSRRILVISDTRKAKIIR